MVLSNFILKFIFLSLLVCAAHHYFNATMNCAPLTCKPWRQIHLRTLLFADATHQIRSKLFMTRHRRLNAELLAVRCQNFQKLGGAKSNVVPLCPSSIAADVEADAVDNWHTSDRPRHGRHHSLELTILLVDDVVSTGVATSDDSITVRDHTSRIMRPGGLHRLTSWASATMLANPIDLGVTICHCNVEGINQVEAKSCMHWDERAPLDRGH
mmetsp:Transcript_69134/g.114931  ORF Transcript_69134/g.114931 Transcript_69134/m.114931 type:complete len:212 (+) Transcript_69134:319-954(+)